jgi:CRP/FNR family transcriptional regulator, cyclic AMP receptor protein
MANRLRKSDKVDLLSHLALFETCTKKELAQVASISVQCRRAAGTILTREGQEGGLFFVILEGEVEVRRGNRKINTLGPGDVVGELSLIDGQARSASVHSVSDVELLEIADEDFMKLVRTSPKFVRNLLRALSLKVRQMDALTS